MAVSVKKRYNDLEIIIERKQMPEAKIKCFKCGKKKPASQMLEIDGDKFCCKVCCGNTAKQEHKQKVKEACEFC